MKAQPLLEAYLPYNGRNFIVFIFRQHIQNLYKHGRDQVLLPCWPLESYPCMWIHDSVFRVNIF